jgi:transposase-like protein
VVHTGKRKLYLFIAIDCISKVAFARLNEKANTATAVAFLNELIEMIPYRVNVVLTDNGIQFRRPEKQPAHLSFEETFTGAADEGLSFGVV